MDDSDDLMTCSSNPKTTSCAISSFGEEKLFDKLEKRDEKDDFAFKNVLLTA